MPCECTGSPFADKDHNEIITGNSKFINNNKFSKNFSKRPMYHENRTIDSQKAKESIITGITSCIESWCALPHHHVLNGRKALILAIDENINHLSSKLTTEKRKSTLKLKDEIIAEELKMLNKLV